MPSSVGAGDGAGSTQQPSIFELSQTAAEEVGKSRLGIVPDTLDMSFIDLSQPWSGYQASANRPALAPLKTERTSVSQQDEDTGWKSNYQALVADLPPGVRLKLEANLQLPASQRDPAYTSLENLLVSTAKSLSTVDAPDDPNIDTNSEINSNVPYAAAGATVTEGINYFQNASNLLNTIGSNNPHSDQISYASRQAENNLSTMNDLVNTLTSTGDMD